MERVKYTSTRLLKNVIHMLSEKHELSLSQLHGQGCYGASNINRKFIDLKFLVSKKYSSTFIFHYFVHSFQLGVADVAKYSPLVNNDF